MDAVKLKSAVEAAVRWLSEVATVKDNRAPGARVSKMPYSFWNGAIRGEYRAATRTWDAFCPIWHTGQAVKALVAAAAALDRPEYLEAARFNAEFIMNNRFVSGPDCGLIAAYEDHPDKVNVSAVLESLDGLLLLSEALNTSLYRDVAVAAARWVAERAYCEGQGIFNDIYDPAAGKFLLDVFGAQGRPLLDDAIMIKCWRLTGEDRFRQIALETAETLLRDEHPAGNWFKYGPCHPTLGHIHPRHAFWWGLPLLEVGQVTGDRRMLDCFGRCVQWYRQAMRRDGGFIRNTYLDFNTDSFGHATSGTACAVIMFLHYYRETGDDGIVPHIELGLDYCLKMQFVNPQDANLQGAILEKVLPPDGSDRSPYHLRDLGTIFFIQATCLYLRIFAGKGKSGA